MTQEITTIPWYGSNLDNRGENLRQSLENSLDIDISKRHTNLDECLQDINKQKRKIMIIIEASIFPKIPKGKSKFCPISHLYLNSLRLIEEIRKSELNKNSYIVIHEPQTKYRGYSSEKYLRAGANFIYSKLEKTPKNQTLLIKSIKERL